MATHNFSTKTGLSATVRTEANDNYYFGIFATVEGYGENRWGTLKKKDGQTLLGLNATQDFKPVFITLPDDIATAIEAEKKEACSKTGKIIIATAKNEKGEVQFEKHGIAIAEPLFKGRIWYRMPRRMERFVRATAKDDAVYDMGGVEDDPEKWDTLYVTSDKGNNYQFSHETNEAFALFGFETKDETWTLNLRIVDLMTED